MTEQTAVEQLRQEIDDLRKQMRMATRPYEPVTGAEIPIQTDHVEHGSDRHAALLGLKKASKGDEPQLDGWTLEDITMFGPSATPKFLEQFLRQKVNELTAPIPETQSRDPREPHFAPTLWRPGRPFAKTTE